MLSLLKIHGYRKFNCFSVDNLSRINFFIGSNNVGKTTILEAIYGWASGLSLSPFFITGILRNQVMQSPYYIADRIFSVMNDRDNLPFKFNISAVDDNEEVTFFHTVYVGDIFRAFVKKLSMSTVAIKNDDLTNRNNSVRFQQTSGVPILIPNIQIAHWAIEDNKSNEKKYNLESSNLFMESVEPKRLASYKDISSHRNTEENMRIYSYLKRQNLLNEFIRNMQSVFPEVKSIDLLPYEDNSPTPISIQLTNKEYYPLDNFGDGFRRWYNIMGSFVLYSNSILCIDEIDATLHPEAQKEFCYNLIKYSRQYNVQLFITTHNLEFIDCFLSAWESNSELKLHDDVRIITMKDFHNETKVRNMTAGEAFKVREAFQMELR